MALLPILEFPDPRLRTKAVPVDAARLAEPSFQQLFDATAPDFTPLYAEVSALPAIDAGIVLAGERQFAAS